MLNREEGGREEGGREGGREGGVGVGEGGCGGGGKDVVMLPLLHHPQLLLGPHKVGCHGQH